ncbi:F-box At3g10240 [Olea europaea subsp. europaea]|uniref:F-box At3g10240 n=1 Tax=Olea europaea subsp. europaea TaxID=158383 RepID=A0A8S0UIK1_OLEEU|nr:F-box At3g10240 [Olea europaea subsp. europaea]
MEIKDGKSTVKEYNETCIGKIRATCNGLILLENRMKKEGFIVMNPVTRELLTIPLGTQSSPHHESYGLVFCHRPSNYKVVHLFRDESQYIGCEIINIGSGSWSHGWTFFWTFWLAWLRTCFCNASSTLASFY